MDSIKRSLGFEGLIVVDSIGQSGGLAFLWRHQEEAQLLSFSHSHIDLLLSSRGLPEYRITGLYGEPNRARRHNTWRLLETLADHSSTPCWLNLFPQASLSNLEVTTSDHCPILLSPTAVRRMPTIRHFRFENAWLREPMCRKMVEDVWHSHSAVPLLSKLDICARELAVWGKDITGSFQKRINECQWRIKLLKMNTDANSCRLLNEENNKLFEILTQKEVFWRQRSKMLWLKEGDNNSKFFHAASRSRKRANQIESLRNSTGIFVDWDHGLQEVMVDYFQQLFQSSASDWEFAINCINRSISIEQNDMMLQPIMEDEVKRALFSMHPDKSPGPDGMTPGFYQRYWDVVGGDVVRLVRDFWDKEVFDEGLTFTNIVLVPKKKCPVTMGDLHPISLCNVLYKIASKVLANRMKCVIDSVISESQSAFIPGRLITDNVMISYEIMHFMKRKTKGKQGYMALKLDMSKAYDRVEWSYLQAVLRRMGFSDKLIRLFMVCVSTASGFGASVEKASGQKINCEKSSIFFSRNTEARVRDEVCGELDIHEADDNTTYLGLPSLLGRKKSSLLGYLNDRIQHRVLGWENKFLSRAGKEILLKTVAQALPNYAMNVFLLPKEISNDLQKTMSNFWWKSSSKKKRGIHWLSWERLCIPKSMGGLGFRNLYDFNISLLGKQCWRLLTSPESLVSRLYKTRYYPLGSFLNAKLGNNPSYIWRSLLEAQSIIQQGTSVCVGSGNTVSILADPWLPCLEDPLVQSSHPTLVNQSVDSLMIPGQAAWDEELVLDLFNARDADLILGIPLNGEESDRWSWRFDKMGMYSVKSAYSQIQLSKNISSTSDNSGFWHKLWHLKVSPKVRSFLWQASRDILPTKVNLSTKHVPLNPLCPLCNLIYELTMHVLVTCSFSSVCWDNIGFRFDSRRLGSFAEFIESTFEEWSEENRVLFAMVSWALWKNRNDLVWKQKGMTMEEVIDQDDGNADWIPPEEGCLKVNTDAGLFVSKGCYSFSCVARNHHGQWVEAIFQCRRGNVTPELAEAIAIKEALSWIKDSGWQKVTLESDCLLVVQALRSPSHRSSYFGRIIDVCKSLLASIKPRVVNVKFIKRSANNVAHSLARSTCYPSERKMRALEAPSDLSALLLQDICYE
ncbi:uncharacterized protein LOC133795435 [Humulus lupulus]|uniref:uncharacterized protein LOC133795435 n=1 Tax=Humulus lupulus TaxID=3486 RepID=UPI002B400A57|nr:uncharacterized protein LOC133795435 [Humulus lupulus]